MMKFLRSFNSYLKMQLSNVNEATFRDLLAKQLNGQTEVRCAGGRIDVLTATEIIEVKAIKQWKQALGQVMVYGLDYPSHRKRLHLFGTDLSSNAMAVLLKSCRAYNIRVTTLIQRPGLWGKVDVPKPFPESGKVPLVDSNTPVWHFQSYDDPLDDVLPLPVEKKPATKKELNDMGQGLANAINDQQDDIQAALKVVGESIRMLTSGLNTLTSQYNALLQRLDERDKKEADAAVAPPADDDEDNPLASIKKSSLVANLAIQMTGDEKRVGSPPKTLPVSQPVLPVKTRGSKSRLGVAAVPLPDPVITQNDS
jgi:hypothetical protein